MCVSKSLYLQFSMSICLIACQSTCPCAWFVCRKVKRTEDREKQRRAVSQCWLSSELMGAGGKTLGRPEPCTIQASL